MGVLHEPVARWIWGGGLGIPPCELLERSSTGTLSQVGPRSVLHRMLPISAAPSPPPRRPRATDAWLGIEDGLRPSFVPNCRAKIALLSGKSAWNSTPTDGGRVSGGKGISPARDVPSISACAS